MTRSLVRELLFGPVTWIAQLLLPGNDVIQMPRIPFTQVAEWEISQLSCGISWRNASYTEFSEADLYLCNKKWLSQEEIFFSICITFILMSKWNALTHLITLLLYSDHQFMHCTVLLCVHCNAKLCCLYSSWFANEAHVANNNND